MKKIEQIVNPETRTSKLEYLFELVVVIADRVEQLIDAHNELLDTHTVKEDEEECETCNWRESEIGYYSPCPAHNNEVQDVKEEPTTPEKKRCDKCGGSGIVSVPPKDWREGADYDVAKCPNCHGLYIL